MKLHLDTPASAHIITGYDSTSIAINRNPQHSGVLVFTDRLVAPWGDGGFDALQPGWFEEVVTARPEVFILGTGPRQRFPDPAMLRPLIDAGIGFEIMDLGSACRTYNILIGEGRRAAAGLLLV